MPDAAPLVPLAVTPRALLWLAASYALGCLTAAYYLTRWRLGRDIREMGSGNVGARNAARALGPAAFAAVFLWDAAKGWLAVAGALWLDLGPEMAVAALVAVSLGHTWPAQLGFRGGKGIAVSLGGIIALDLTATGLLVAIFLPSLALIRSFTLGGLTAFTAGPFAAWIFERPVTVVVGMLCTAVLVLYTHRQNIRDELARRGRAPAPVSPTAPDSR